ncbi:MAG: PAS domain S-box protein, partial [Candidatus Omnitrophota bacterium]
MKNDKNFNIAQELAQLRDRLDKTEGILDGLIIIDFTGTLLHCNQSAVTMFGYRTPADGIGKKVFTFIHPDHREKVARNMKKVFRKGSGFLSPYIVVKKDGTEFWVESLGHKIAYQGMPAEMIVIRDVTERKRMEIALKDARDQLEVTVEQRTRELKETNRLLRAEIVERKKAEQ